MSLFFEKLFFSLVRKAFVKEASNYHFYISGLALVLGASGLIYFQIVDLLDPSMNLVRYAWNESSLGEPAANFKAQNPEYEDLSGYIFYAGKPGGYYHKIGAGLEEAWQPEGAGDLTMIPYGGSTMIARAVYTNERALGIVQEDALRDLDLTEDKVQIIAPLYDELVHLFYRRASFPGTGDGSLPVLHPENSWPWWGDFENAVTRIQSSAAPGFPLGYYLLHFGNVFPTSYQAASIEETITLLNADPVSGENHVDLAIVIAGAPLEQVATLDFDKVGLMAVAPGLTRLINPTMDIALRPSGFAGVYDDLMTGNPGGGPRPAGGSDVPTLASRAMLIASRDVPSWIIRDVGASLNEMKVLAEAARKTRSAGKDETVVAADDGQEVQEVQKEEADASVTFPLSKYPFDDSIKKEYAGMTQQMIPMWLLFLGIVFLCSRAVYNVLTWAISNYKHARYSRDINEVYKRLPCNSELNGLGSPEPTPAIDANHELRINKLIEGISELLKQAETIRDDFVSGGIQVGHQSNLIDTLYGVKTIFQHQLAQRINEALMNGFPVSRQRIRRLYTAGYIEMPAYCELGELADRVAEMRPLDSLVEPKADAGKERPEPESGDAHSDAETPDKVAKPIP